MAAEDITWFNQLMGLTFCILAFSQSTSKTFASPHLSQTSGAHFPQQHALQAWIYLSESISHWSKNYQIPARPRYSDKKIEPV